MTSLASATINQLLAELQQRLTSIVESPHALAAEKSVAYFTRERVNRIHDDLPEKLRQMTRPV